MRPIAAGDRAVASVLKDMNWRREDVVVSADEASTAFSNSRCYFFRMHHRLIPGAGVMRFVLDGDGSLRARSGDMDGLAHVLRTCLPPDAGAAPWADLIAGFSGVKPPRVMGPDDKLAQVGLPAGQYRPPIKQIMGSTTQVEFFATAHDLRMFRVKAVLPDSGPVRIDMQPMD